MAEKISGRFINIRVNSALNEWMDCIFIVESEDADRAVEVLNEAADEFWDTNCACYGDFLEESLQKAGIEYDAYYKKEQE